jgi:3-carboxy-cis,cis-muconate cycloisomerase
MVKTAGHRMASHLRELFAPEARRRRYLEVEAALAEAEGELGLIPAAAAAAIARAARSGDVHAARVEARFTVSGHSMMALVEELADVVGDHGGWVHWGATTQNIQQTGDVLVLRDAHAVLSGLVVDVLQVLADLANGPPRCRCRDARTGSTRCRSPSG